VRLVPKKRTTGVCAAAVVLRVVAVESVVVLRVVAVESVGVLTVVAADSAPFATLMLSFVSLEFAALFTFPPDPHATTPASAATRSARLS
jgi:hypothetical protein